MEFLLFAQYYRSPGDLYRLFEFFAPFFASTLVVVKLMGCAFPKDAAAPMVSC